MDYTLRVWLCWCRCETSIQRLWIGNTPILHTLEEASCGMRTLKVFSKIIGLFYVSHGPSLIDNLVVRTPDSCFSFFREERNVTAGSQNYEGLPQSTRGELFVTIIICCCITSEVFQEYIRGLVCDGELQQYVANGCPQSFWSGPPYGLVPCSHVAKSILLNWWVTELKSSSSVQYTMPLVGGKHLHSGCNPNTILSNTKYGWSRHMISILSVDDLCLSEVDKTGSFLLQSRSTPCSLFPSCTFEMAICSYKTSVHQ